MAPQQAAPPLAGLRVLDLSRLLPGGYATMLIADLGADVLKVEEPGRGDYTRWMPPFAANGDSGWHLALNRGKRSLTLNLKHPEGVALLRELARDADVLVESFRPGVLDRLGVGWQTLREDNARLIYCAITGYGATGPLVDRAGHDINFLSYAGALSFSGHAETGPWMPGLQIGDLGGGGMLAVIAVLAALRAREVTGCGQFCDVSMTDGVMSWLSIHAGAFAATGQVPRPGHEVLNGGYAWYGVYACADGRQVSVGALEPPFFRVLLRRLDLEELEPWHMDADRQEDLRRRLAAAFATRSRDAWMEFFEHEDACVAPVLDLAEAFDSPQAVERGMVVEQTLGDGSAFRQVGVVPRLSRTPGKVGPVAAQLGADTDDVLRTLGRTVEQIDELRRAGVV